MKFTVSQSALTEALSIVSKGIAPSSTLPILSGVLISAQDGVIEFQTSNYTISIRHRIPAHVEVEGKTVIPCKTITNICKTLPDAPITFELKERQISITCETSSFQLNTLAIGDFPEFPTFALERSVELPANVLSDMVTRVWRVTSTDKNRPVLNGVYMTVENNTIRLVATDSYRLAICDTQVETSSLEGSFELNVPAEAFNDALSITSGKGTILLGATDTQVVFVAGNTTYVSRRIEGIYPNYNMLLPQTCNTTVKIDIPSLLSALKSVASITQTNSAVQFNASAEQGTLTLSVVSSDHDAAKVTINADIQGNSNINVFNYNYILNCLTTLNHEKEIILELLDGSNQPGVFKIYDKINYLYLVMPINN